MRRYFAFAVALAVSLILVNCATARDSLLFPSRDRAYRALWAFDAICLAHRLDRAGALKAAADDGWLVLPDGQMPAVGGVQDVTKGLNMTVLHARWKPSESGDMVLLLGGGGSAGEGCAIAFRSGFRMAASVMGGSEMAPMPRFAKLGPNYDLWAFVEEEGGRRRAVKNRDGKIDHGLIAGASADGRFATIAVMGSDTEQASLYLYAAPRPRNAGAPP